MEWLNEPASWQRTGDVLTVSVDPGTDFWRETGYGYIRDSGHVYGEVLAGDLDVSVRLRCTLSAQYDQAGVMLRADERTWLKTGVEFFEGRGRLSTVLTHGRSSWMVTDLPAGTDEIVLRVSRRGDAVEVRYVIEDGPAELAALVFMPPDREVLAGVMAAAPEGPGFRVTFHDLHITERDWSSASGEEPAAWPDEQAGWAGAEAPAWAPADGEPGWPEPGTGEDTSGWPATAEEESRSWPVPAATDEDPQCRFRHPVMTIPPGPPRQAESRTRAGRPPGTMMPGGWQRWPPTRTTSPAGRRRPRRPRPATGNALACPSPPKGIRLSRPGSSGPEPSRPEPSGPEPSRPEPSRPDRAAGPSRPGPSGQDRAAGIDPAGAEPARPGSIAAPLAGPEPGRPEPGPSQGPSRAPRAGDPEPAGDEPAGRETAPAKPAAKEAPAGEPAAEGAADQNGAGEHWSPAPVPGDWAKSAAGGTEPEVDPAADWERLAAGAQAAARAQAAGAQAARWRAQTDTEVANEWPGPPLRTAVRNGLLAGDTVPRATGDPSEDDAQTDPGLPKPRPAAETGLAETGRRETGRTEAGPRRRLGGRGPARGGAARGHRVRAGRARQAGARQAGARAVGPRGAPGQVQAGRRGPARGTRRGRRVDQPAHRRPRGGVGRQSVTW